MQLEIVTLETFSQSLSNLKSQYGLSHAELAQVAGVSRAAVYKWLAGNTPPGSLELLKLARHFNVSMETLLTGDAILADAAQPPSRIPQETLDLAKQAAEAVVALQDRLKKMA